MGHDWGGIIAFKAAIDHPDRITRLALLDTLCTVWAPRAVHGWWFKVEGLAEEQFGRYHREFIEVLFGGRDAAVLGTRPASPWPIPPGDRSRPDVDRRGRPRSLRARLLRPRRRGATPSATTATRLPVPPGAARPRGRPRRALRVAVGDAGGRDVVHDGGLEAHPWHAEAMDYGPEDRHKRFPHPALWLYGGRRSAEPWEQGRTEVPSGNPFVDQFSRYFPDLRARSVAAGHFLGEEAPAYVNETLVAFLRGEVARHDELAGEQARTAADPS